MARQAYQVLVNEGRVDLRRGSGAFVREPTPVRRVAADRYLAAAGGAAGPETAFTRDQDMAWSDYRLEVDFEEAHAPPMVAELLQVDETTMVLARSFVFYDSGVPEQSSVSWLIAELVNGTPIADPGNEPWPGGTIAQLETIGVTVHEVEEVVTARMPTPAERRRLQIAEGVPVLCITRRMLSLDAPTAAAGLVPVEAAEIVRPADRVELVYRVPLARP